MPNAQQVMELAARGWRVVPLFGVNPDGSCSCGSEKCSSPGKHPWVKAWNTAASIDESDIYQWWERRPKSNVGVVMGPSSGIIDLECDSPEAEKFLIELFETSEIYTPTFKSSRGVHRLFKYTSELPNSEKAHWRLPDLDLDFKIGNGDKGSYCVFPPSYHPSGARYQWVLNPDDYELAEIPDLVIAKLHAIATEGNLTVTESKRKPKEHFDRILQGVGSGERNESAASLIGNMISGMANPADQSQQRIQFSLVQTWNSKNNPPLEPDELETTFLSILNREIEKRRVTPFQEKKVVEDSDNPCPSWKLVRVEADPPYYRLFSPLWDGNIRLSDEELLNPHSIRLAAQKQKCACLEVGFKKFWEGGKNVKVSAHSYLMQRIEREEAEFEERLENRIGMHLLEAFESAQESDEPSWSGQPRIVGDDCWFTTNYLIDNNKVFREHEQVVYRLLKDFSQTKVRQKDRNRKRYRVLSENGFTKLKELAFYGVSEADLSLDKKQFSGTE